MNTLYVDPERKVGSQSESPTIRYSGDYIYFDGYQQYSLSKDSIRTRKSDHRKKYGMIRPYLLGFNNRSLSLIDLGCSAGVMGFQAYLDGFRNITFVDHDAEYLELVQAGLKHIDATIPTVVESKVEGLKESADVLFAFAIIHWLYSATEQFGSLERIIEKLAQHAKRTLFIEWVGPECPDMKGFGHLSLNTDVHTDAYTRENFLAALENNYKNVVHIGELRTGRELWMATNDESHPSLVLRMTESLAFAAWRVKAKLRRMFAGPVSQRAGQ